MKKIIFLIAVFPLMAYAQKTTPSAITKVIVYQQGAKITNEASTSLSPGNNEIILKGIPLSINTNTIQAKVSGGAVLLSAYFQSRQLENEKIPVRTKTLEDSVKLINKEMQWLKNEKSVYLGEEKLIQQNQVLGTTEQKVSVDEIILLSKFYRERLLDIRKKIHNIDIKTIELKRELSKVQSKLNELQYAEKKVVGEIVLNVSSNKTTTSKIQVTYVTYQAGWTPLYDIRTVGANKPVNLVYKANVYQSSGIDWDKVDLTISTGNPLANNDRPYMYPWYINYYQPVINQNRYKKEAAPAMAMQNAMQRVSRELESTVEEEFDDAPVIGYTVTETTSSISAEYYIEAEQDIPSDGKTHLVAMKEYELSSKFNYHSIPKLDRGAFMIAKVADYGKYNLLPGQANLFFDGMYIGQSNLDPQTTVDSLILSFGRDEKIIVKRNQLQDQTARQSIGGNTKETKAFEITVRNNNSFSVVVELMDQIPIAKNKEIEVKLEDPGNAKYDEPYGSLLWKLNIPAGQSKKVKFVYSVKYPKDKTISGL